MIPRTTKKKELPRGPCSTAPREREKQKLLSGSGFWSPSSPPPPPQGSTPSQPSEIRPQTPLHAALEELCPSACSPRALLPLTTRSLFSGRPDLAGAMRELPFITASRSHLQAPMPAPSSPRSTSAVPGAVAEAAAAWGQCWLPAPPASRPAPAP